MGVISYLTIQLKTLEVTLTSDVLCTYHPLARSCLFCFPDIFYIYPFLSSSLPFGYDNTLLLHLTTSTLISLRLILLRTAREILQKKACLITSQHWEPSDCCPSASGCAFQDLKGWKVPHYPWGQTDSIAVLPTFCQFPIPAISPKCYPSAILMIIFWTCCLVSVIFLYAFSEFGNALYACQPCKF